jgi:flagellar biosynthesis component FlhA
MGKIFDSVYNYFEWLITISIILWILAIIFGLLTLFIISFSLICIFGFIYLICVSNFDKKEDDV